MMNLKSQFLNILQERELLYQCSDLKSLDDHLYQNKDSSAYIGFDSTATSLHAGSLIQIILLKYFQQSGHNVIPLLGDGTSLVGDPSGKDKSRLMLTEDNIKTNTDGIKQTLQQFFKIDDKNYFVHNSQWLKNFNYIEFLREYGPKFSINKMLSFDSVKTRLSREQNLTFLEFNYMLLQAIDYLYLYKNHDVTLQMGGSDQWGNIVNGIDLVKRMTSKQVYGLTTALITSSSGKKMGKTEKGTIWLDKNMLSYWDFYQYFRNVSDDDVILYLKKFTQIPMEEINKLSNLQAEDLNIAKKLLAFEVTKLCHGEKNALHAEKTAINTFEKNILDENLPTFYYSENLLNTGILLIDVLVKSGLVKSKSQGKKDIQGGAIKINGEKCSDITIMINKTYIKKGYIQISFGKKKHILIKIKE